MQRLLDEAEKLSGVKYNIDSFADITEAIHVMQENMGIAGTTSKEAASTISGSIGMMKAAWENFLTGMADPDQDFGELVGGLTDSIGIALGNIVPRLVQALPRLIEGLAQVIQTLAGYLPEIVGALLPGLVEGATKLLVALSETLPGLFDVLFNQVLPQVISAFQSFLEKVFSVPPGSFDGLSTAFEAVLEVVKGTVETVENAVSWFQKGGPAVDVLTTAIVAITSAVTAYLAITKAMVAYEIIKNGIIQAGTAIQAAFNAVMSANPIMIVIIAITALVAGLVWFFTQTETGKQIWQGFMDFLGSAWNTIATTAQAVWTALASFFSGLWSDISSTAQSVWNTILGFLSGLWNGILSLAQGCFNFLVAFYSGIWNAISSTVMAVWNGISSFLSGLWSSIVNTASSVFRSISNTISRVMNGISSTVSNVWNGIKNTISNAINGAKNIVSNAINAIRGLFNFKFRWPHIPIPHFSISGSVNPLDWLKGGLPKIGVQWYAKGGIMNGPTMFGMNGNNAMIGGEAGPEAVLPLNDKTLGGIGRGILDASEFSNGEVMAVLFEILSVLKAIYDKDGSVYIDSDKLIGHIWKKLRDKFAFEDNVDLIFRRGT